MPGSWPLLHIFVVFQLLFHTIWDKRLKIETPVVLNGTGMLLIFWNIKIVNRGLTMMAMVRKSVIIVINLMTLIILQLEVFLDACFRPSCPSLRLWKYRSQVFRSFGEIQLTMFEKYVESRCDPDSCDTQCRSSSAGIAYSSTWILVMVAMVMVMVMMMAVVAMMATW